MIFLALFNEGDGCKLSAILNVNFGGDAAVVIGCSEQVVKE
jgi:hypothetical protein